MAANNIDSKTQRMIMTIINHNGNKFRCKLFALIALMVMIIMFVVMKINLELFLINSNDNDQKG